MITKEQAVNLGYRDELHHVTRKNSDGSPMRVRVNGAVKTWKKRPSEFQIPVKHGLRSYGYITHLTASEWAIGDGRGK